LTVLRTARLVDVAAPDDVLPNQTVFVLAHLADHLDHPDSPAPRPGEGPEAYVARKLDSEARAYLSAWHATLDEAVHRSGDAPLSMRQIATLLLNCRYRFALIGNVRTNVTGPHLETTGLIEATPSNIGAITRTLRQSPIADLE
jgi:hypothetical protein